MTQLRVLLSFAQATDPLLEKRAGAVLTGVFSNPVWASPPAPAPPVSEAELAAAISDFREAIPTAKQGGPADTAAKNKKREVLVGLLRQLAAHVQGNCGGDLGALLASGFAAVDTNNAPAAMAKPDIKDILNGLSGQLVVRLQQPIASTRLYEVRYALLEPSGAPGPWQSGGLSTDSRRLNVNGLAPGSLYQFQVRSHGAREAGDWSDPTSHRCL